MELLFIVIGGAILGAIAHYSLPLRAERGSVLLPATGAAAAAIVWEGLTWLGWAWDGGWIWWAALIAAAVASYLVDIIVSRARVHSDAEMLARLTKAGTAA